MSFDLYRDRKRDAETVRGRTFMIELSDGDMVDFSRLAKEHGTTPTEILQGFICDLINGTYTRGSDERDYAYKYFNRCLYGYGDRTSFLVWLLKGWTLDAVSDFLEEPDGQEIKDLYTEYAEDQERQREPAQDMQEGIEEVRAYLQELKTITAKG